MYGFEDVALAAGKRTFQNYYINKRRVSKKQSDEGEEEDLPDDPLAEIDQTSGNYLRQIDEIWEIRKGDHENRLHKTMDRLKKKQSRKESKARRKTDTSGGGEAQTEIQEAATEVDQQEPDQGSISAVNSKFVV